MLIHGSQKIIMCFASDRRLGACACSSMMYGGEVDVGGGEGVKGDGEGRSLQDGCSALRSKRSVVRSDRYNLCDDSAVDGELKALLE